jgi:hypothetical protein
MRFRNDVANSVPLCFKPASATLCVVPQLLVRTHRVLTVKQVVSPFGITQGIWLEWSLDTGLTAITELTLSSLTAPGAFDQ